MAWKHNLRIYGPGFVWISCGFGASLAYAYPHTLGLDEYRKMTTVKSDGKPVEVSREVHELANEIKTHFKWQKSFLHFGAGFEFIQTAQPLDFTQRGSNTTRWGVIIGIPALFSISSVKAARENNETESSHILELYNLSTAAKKFALAKEMCYADTVHVQTSFVLINAAFVGTYVIAKGLSNILSAFLPLPAALMISFLSMVPVVTYVSVKLNDLYHCIMMQRADVRAAHIDADVADGGLEYYTKLIASKQALEKMKEKYIAEEKRDSIFDMKWRRKELSLEERKSNLQKALGKLSSE